METEENRFNREKELTSASRCIRQIVNLLADGMDSKGLRAERIELEHRAETLAIDTKVENATPVNVIEIHPQLPARYIRKVKTLSMALQEGVSSRAQAIEVLRAIITDITIKPGLSRGEVLLELQGSIPAVLAFASARWVPIILGLYRW